MPDKEEKDFISPRDTLEPKPGDVATTEPEPEAEEVPEAPEEPSEEAPEKPETEVEPLPDGSEEAHEQPEEIKEEPEPEHDAGEHKVKEIPIGGSPLHRFKRWYGSHKKWSIPLTLLLIALIAFAVPSSRYKIASYGIKKDFAVKVMDSNTHTPVSGAQVRSGNLIATTDGNGNVVLYGMKVGVQNLLVTKKYYQDQNIGTLVPISNQTPKLDVQLKATGRQTKISVSNVITDEKLDGVDILVGDVKAKTDKDGNATVVLPAGKPTQKAILSLEGYSKASVDIQVSDQEVKQNNITLTPSGKVYFVSKRSGKLDVMKVNLDGTDAKVVIPGTGVEQENSTLLSTSPNGNYAALVTKRSPGDPAPQLYVFSSDDEKLLTLESGNIAVNVEGWSGDNLIYTVKHNDLPDFQAGKSKLKAYSATTGKTLSLDQSEGSDPNASLSQIYGFVTVSGSNIVAARQWVSGVVANLEGKQDSLVTIVVNGQNPKTVATYPASGYLEFSQHSPVALYIWSTPADDTSKNTFYDYTVGGTPKQITLTSDKFYQSQHIYYFSPSNKQTVWTEERDGKSTFLVGDESGSNPSAIAALADFSSNGWYTDKYLLISKKSNELFIMTAKTVGQKEVKQVKLTDYQATYNYYQ